MGTNHTEFGFDHFHSATTCDVFVRDEPDEEEEEDEDEGEDTDDNEENDDGYSE